ncbi:MAG: DUF58 domain-containing protein [Nanoarchaeota archaeon]
MKEIRVNFAPMLKRLEVYAKKQLISSGFTGQYATTFKGRGLEFEGYRRFSPMEDARLIDWLASVRANQLVIREFVQERQLQILFVFDVSSSMLFASTEKLKCEYAAEFIGAMAFAIINGGDAAGLLMFTDKVVHQLPPSMGPRQFYLIARSLQNPKLYEGKRDFVAMLKWINNFVKRNTTVVIVSDFLGTHGEWLKELRIAGQKFDLIGVMIHDPHDITLPDVGQVVISDPYSMKEMLIDTGKIKKEFERNAKSQMDEVQDGFKKSNADLVSLTTDKEFVDPIKSFFERRKSRWR